MTNSEKDISDLIQADAMHHGNIGDLYFSMRIKEAEYIICAAYAPHEWDKVILVELEDETKQTKQNKPTQNLN